MSVDRLEMLAPHGVPTDSVLSRWVGRAAMVEAALSARPRGRTAPAMAVEVVRLLEVAPRPPSTAIVVDGLPDDVAHDAYFHVARVDGDAATTFVRMALSARAILLAEAIEAPVALAASMLGEIDRALADLLSCLLGGEVGALPTVEAWPTGGARTAVMPRWIRGHQIFAALTQGLVLSFGAMARAIRAGDEPGMRRWADLTISLLRGSGASFVLTGDFSVEDYLRDVRPSMMPPAAPTCLSGLMSIDHRVLVQTIRDLKPALRSLHERDRARHDRIHAELKTVYDRHIHVCERFVGERPSLLTAGNTEKSGPALIEQFKTLRLKAFESANHAVRLGSPPTSPPPGHQKPEPQPKPQSAPGELSCPYHAATKHESKSNSQT